MPVSLIAPDDLVRPSTHHQVSVAEATFDDVVKLTLYVTDMRPETMGPALAAMDRARLDLGLTATPPLTGIGVSALASEDYLLELEAVAVLA